MKTFKEYRKEQATKREAKDKIKPSMETSFGEHSLTKPKPSMETSFGEHSKEKLSEESEAPSHERTAEEHKRVHEKAAPSKELNVHEKAPIESYTDSSTGLNGMLHHFHNGHNFSKSYLRHAHALSNVLDKHKTKEDTHTYTGLKHSPAKHFESSDKPAHLHLPAFTSTSTSFKSARGFSDPAYSKKDTEHGVESGPTYGEGAKHVLKLHIPKGTSAMSVKKHSFLPRENEVLLNRGHDIKIHPKPEKHTDTNGEHTYIWHAHVVGHSPAKLPEYKEKD